MVFWIRVNCAALDSRVGEQHILNKFTRRFAAYTAVTAVAVTYQNVNPG